MADKEKTNSVREALGVFSGTPQLRSAIRELQHAGFDREQLGLLASEQIVRESMSDLYAETNAELESDQAPKIAFVSKESVGEATESLGGSLFFVSSSTVMGAVVASSAIFGGALMAALSGFLTVGLIGVLVSLTVNQSDAEFIQQQVDKGQILLFVRVSDPVNEVAAKDILARFSGLKVKVYDISAKSAEKKTQAIVS